MVDRHPLEVPKKTYYRVTVYFTADSRLDYSLNSCPVITSVGDFIKLDFLNGQIRYFSRVDWIQIDEVKE